MRFSLERLSIRERLIGLVIVAMLPALAVAAWHLNALIHDARDHANRQARLLTDVTAANLSLALNDAQRLLARLAEQPQVRALDPHNCDPIFKDFGAIYPQYTTLSLRRLDGSSVCSFLSPPPRQEDVVKSSWFREAVARGAPVVGDAYQGPVTRRWTTPLTHPVRDASGAQTGVLILPLDLAALNERSLARPPAQGVVMVSDREHRMLLRSPDFNGRAGQLVLPRFIEHFEQDGRAYFEEAGVDGVVRLYAVQQLPLTGWRVAAGIRSDEVFADLQREVVQVSAAISIALLAAVALALWMARSIARPIGDLGDVARRVAGGDRRARAAVTGPGELAAVAAQFNRALDVQDESERKLAENEARFRALTTLSSDWYWEQDHEYRFVDMSPRIDGHGTMTSRQHIGLRRWDIPSVDMTDAEWQRHREQVERHEPFRDFILRRRGNDGGVRIFAISGDPIFADDGSFTGYRGIGREITAQQRDQDELRAREMQYRELLDHLSAGVVVHRPDTSVLLANRQACQLLRLSQEQMQGRIATDASWRFVREDGSPMPVDEYPVARVLATHQPVTDLVAGIEPLDAAERVWVLAQAFPELDARGTLSRVVVTFIDITARKNAAQWRAEKDASELASRSKSQFLSRVSHELRTPLNAILGFGQLMQFDASVQSSPKTRERVGYIMSAGRHLLALVNDILDLTRAEVGALGVTDEPVDVARLAVECATLVAPQADACGIAIDTIGTGDARWTRTDPSRLRQVLMNLLSNAVKYNRATGRVVLRLTADERHLRLDVEDSGPGLSRQQLDSLFQPFNRLGAERTTAEGTGIGLVISKLLVQALGGELTVSSQVGKGSTFSVVLPRAAFHPPAEHDHAIDIVAASAEDALKVP